jgi:hypothetical protein
MWSNSLPTISRLRPCSICGGSPRLVVLADITKYSLRELRDQLVWLLDRARLPVPVGARRGG